MRVVSLIASSTEILCALGLRQQMVGRSHECDHPHDVLQLPACTRPRFDTVGTSLEIDSRVKSTLQSGLSVYEVDEAVLRSLAPDLIVTQSQCEVCAVSLKDVEAALHTWLESRPRVVSLQPNWLADIWDDIGRVASAAGCETSGEALVHALQERLDALRQRTAALKRRPTVACLEWIEPLMAAGNWMPELVELAGGDNLFGTAGGHSPWMTFEDLQMRDPDVIIVMPCGFDLARTREEMPALTGHPGWSALSAVRTGRIYLTDGNQYFNRPGPRVVESAEILAEVLHPDMFHFGHEGSGWERLTRSSVRRPGPV